MSIAQLVNPLTGTKHDQLCINTIRTLSIDAVQQAKSGHPGTPMALAPLIYTIWNRVLRFDPQDPIWPNRDRFILSNGCFDAALVGASFERYTRKLGFEPDQVIAAAKEQVAKITKEA
jgi:transketolase N-terminal domain/subunit